MNIDTEGDHVTQGEPAEPGLVIAPDTWAGASPRLPRWGAARGLVFGAGGTIITLYAGLRLDSAMARWLPESLRSLAAWLPVWLSLAYGLAMLIVSVRRRKTEPNFGYGCLFGVGLTWILLVVGLAGLLIYWVTFGLVS